MTRIPRYLLLGRRLAHRPSVPPIPRRSISTSPPRFAGGTCRVLSSRSDSPASAAAVRPTEDYSDSSHASSSTPSSAPSRSRARPAHPSAITSTDDLLLPAHFDEPWSSTSVSAGPSTSLFGFPPLTSPDRLLQLTDRTLIAARAIVRRIVEAPLDPTGKELRLVVKNLDRLSDTLCGVIDMCELVRNVHPDSAWVARADEAYERLCSCMNELNTDQGLYKALVATMRQSHAVPLSEAETQVAITFLRDFEKSGIHLPEDLRTRFVELSDSLLTVGRTFLSYASSGPPSDPLIEIPEADKLLVGLGSRFIDSLPRGRLGKRSSRYVTPGSWESQMIARFAREGEARRLVYVGNMAYDKERVDVLERMLKERSELAGVLGKETWAEVALVDKMAKTPGNVMGFLQSLATHHKPAAAADIATLQRLKAISLTGTVPPGDLGTSTLAPLNAWDRDFFSERHALSLNSSSLPPITPYLSVGTVLLGLSRLFTRLYGISFRPAPVTTGEVWHPSVRRLDVVDEMEGLIGVIYCDLFSREGKPPSAAHYTVRTSRRVDDDDAAGDRLVPGWDEAYGPGLEVEGERQEGREGRYQLPIVVLTTDFGTVSPGQPALLSWTDMETLFHEMGHAIHSMIGRTEYHNVSGTRCATDFVELPSILMEHFVSSPAVLSLFASHYATGEPLPMPLLQSHLNVQSSLSALETHSQILMAILDQEYHSLRQPDLDTFDSSAVYHRLQNELGVISPVDGTAWQTQFGHLYGYGATYYSYLFDRAIAGKVWLTLFNHTPEGSLRREAGETLKHKVLKWGGGKDPWEMVGSVIGGHEGDAVARGDEKAMEIVGGWMIR